MKLSPSQKIVFGLFLSVVFLYSFNRINDSDIFYHLKTGQIIWETKQIPRQDIFSYTAPGARWITHEWLAELIFYGVHKLGGFWGLVGFVAALAVVTYCLLLGMALRKGADFYLTVAVFLVVGLAGFRFWVPRPQSFAFLSLALLLYFLERQRATLRRAPLVLSVLTVWFWANVNASVVLGLLIFGVYFLAAVLKKKNGRGNVKNLTMAFAAAIALSFLNPNTYAIFTYGLAILPAARALGINEWRSIFAFGGGDVEIFISEITLAAVFLLWRLGVRKKSRDLAWLGLALGASAMPFVAARHLSFWSLMVSAPLASELSSVAGDFAARHRRTFSVAAASVISLLLFFKLTALPSNYVKTETLPIYPAYAADFMEKSGLRGPLFSLYDSGGYLIWRLWPKEKIFIDSRSDVFAGGLVQEYLAIKNNAPGAAYLINAKYHINYFLVPYSQSAPSKLDLLVFSLWRQGWRVVFWDDDYLIIVRDDPVNRDVIERFGLKYAGPFLPPDKISKENLNLALQELRELRERSPNSKIIEDYTRDVLAAHGASGPPAKKPL